MNRAEMKSGAKEMPDPREALWWVDDDARWRAVGARDARADGQFVYGVTTTGVYCKPSCKSRMPRRENVQFFSDPHDAEQAGFRPCKRCQPNGPGLAGIYGAAVERACRAIQSSSEPLKLKALAKAVGMSTFHFHRVFTKLVGLTPKAYANAHRAERVRKELRQRGTVTEAIYRAGFNSSGGFYRKSEELLGMGAKQFQKGGAGATIRFAVGECSLGAVLVAASAKGVCAVFLGDDPGALVHELEDRFPRARLVGGDEAFERVVSQVAGFIDHPRGSLALPLDVQGTAFQQKVWQQLLKIPFGTTRSYAEIAEAIGHPQAVRAVAAACASNKVAVAIPCHRVVRSDGSLSGYRWGVARKAKLLEAERRSRASGATGE